MRGLEMEGRDQKGRFIDTKYTQLAGGCHGRKIMTAELGLPVYSLVRTGAR